MNTLTLIWIAFPCLAGFISYMISRLARWLALGVTIASALYALWHIAAPPTTLQLLGNFGVTLMVDSLSSFFILTNALVTGAVVLYCWSSDRSAFFYTQLILLHGSVNSAFICADFISLYVALEVLSIAAFLLVAYPRSDRTIWVGLRYLFISNVAMLFYLVGVLLIYRVNHSFAFTGLQNAPTDAIALIFVGLLTKGGVFVSGMWLPLTYAESDTPVSAMLSGIVTKTGVFPLVRFALMVEEINPVVRLFGVGAALLGVACAIFEKDSKRILAFSSISQLGWIMVAPAVGGIYALAHGLVKPALFLTVGNLPNRDIQALRQKPIDKRLWLVLVVASLSISGFPLLVGFGAKILTLDGLVFWQAIAMNVAAVGTAIVYAKFIFLPHQSKQPASIQPGFWPAIILLVGGLFVANIVYLEAYTLANIAKALALIAAGWLIHMILIRRVDFRWPRVLEQFEHLIGVMSLMLVLLFSMVFA